MAYRAVLFDLGGVVLESPLHVIADFEKERGLPTGFIARVVGGYAARPEGPWQRLERGELPLGEFCQAFDAEIAALGHTVSTAEMMARMAEKAVVRPEMLAAIRALRAARLKVAALTNNWEPAEGRDERMDALRGEFHVFVESCKVGMRKPDPRIYEHTLDALEVSAHEAVFLDDIGSNLKAARALGMTTIKVTDATSALQELATTLSLELG